jgi:hypothetical protein
MQHLGNGVYVQEIISGYAKFAVEQFKADNPELRITAIVFIPSSNLSSEESKRRIDGELIVCSERCTEMPQN